MATNRNIKAMEVFLREQNMNIPNKLDKLGEQYTMAIFKNLRIKKNPETHETTPDFTFYVNERDLKTNTINKKSFQMETTVLGDIYDHIFGVLLTDYRNKIETFLREYEVILDPLNIHIEDEEIFKSVFMERMKELKDEKKITIKGKVRNYTITSKKLDHSQKFPMFSGTIKNAESNLRNIISKKSDQLKKTDVIFFIVLNEYIYDLELIQTIYREHGIGSLPRNNKKEFTIVQYQFDNTIWEISDYNLKYAVFCYPAVKKIYLCPSLKFDSNSPIIFWSLMACFNKFNFDVEVAKHGTKWVK